MNYPEMLFYLFGFLVLLDFIFVTKNYNRFNKQKTIGISLLSALILYMVGVFLAGTGYILLFIPTAFTLLILYYGFTREESSWGFTLAILTLGFLIFIHIIGLAWACIYDCPNGISIFVFFVMTSSLPIGHALFISISPIYKRKIHEGQPETPKENRLSWTTIIIGILLLLLMILVPLLSGGVRFG